MININMKTLLFLAGVFSVVVFGCSQKNTPRETVLRFIGAVSASDKAELGNILSFERLIAEKEGEKYAALPQQEKNAALSQFKANMLNSLTAGNLKFFGQLNPVVREERISGNNAEVLIYERKNKSKGFMFTLVEEGGVWKICRIAAL